MKERVWHKGPPPHVGWWNASWGQSERDWRWWNGKNWSHSVSFTCEPKVAASLAEKPYDGYGGDIYWTHYWPEHARVPRINPESP
jgi:hypothetical protein